MKGLKGKEDLYAEDGVNVLAGDEFSSFSGKMCQATQDNSPYVVVHDFSNGYFRGPKSFQIVGLPDRCGWDCAPDGIGTKSNLITAALRHDTAAHDLIAMTCGDITRWGGLPLLFTNVLDVSNLGQQGSQTNLGLRKLMMGLIAIANKQRIVLYKGETAELGVCVGSDDPEAVTKFNWAGMAIGAFDPHRIINADDTKVGDKVVALREVGFRSNGISSVRKALAIRYGEEWWLNQAALYDIDRAARPSVLYDSFLSEANGWYEPRFEPIFKPTLIAHLSGGGIHSKLGTDLLFPRGLSADLNDLWEPPDVMVKCAEWRGMDDAGCYATWNGGQGALVALRQEEVEGFIKMAQRFGIEAKICGEIVKDTQPQVVIRSKFSDQQIEFISE